MSGEPVSKLKKLQAAARDALDDSWMAQHANRRIPPPLRFVHFVALVIRSFVRNRCPTRASSLAYASLLALAPMVAVVIGVSASLLRQQDEKQMQGFVDSIVRKVTPAPVEAMRPEVEPSNGEVDGEPPELDPQAAAGALLNPEAYVEKRDQLVERIHEFVGNIRSGTLGATGMVALLAIVLMMLSRIEDTFNDIWGVTRGRSWYARIISYWGAMTLGPILLAATFTLTTHPHLDAVRDYFQNAGGADIENARDLGARALNLGRTLLPYFIWSLAFTVFYKLMPNTKVLWRAAAVGGLVGGCLWQLNSEFSVLYVSRVVTNSKIYGGLAIIPVFMIGLYIGWFILLLGAQVSYAWQNRRTYLEEKQAEGVHQRSREFIGLRLMAHAGRRFSQGGTPATLTHLAEATGVPTQLVGELVTDLVSGGLLVETTNGDTAYSPAKPLDRISAQDVLDALRTGNGTALATRSDDERDIVRDEFRRIAEAERGVAGTITLLDLADKFGPAASGE